jgi:hypothetical protein
MWLLHRRALARRVRPIVPAGVLAQASRDDRVQVNLARLLADCLPDDLTWDAARRIGRLLARTGRSDVVDAHVVVGAVERGDAVVTSDPNDLQTLAGAVGRRLDLIPI